ncbi:MAG: hypothetical protein Hyperionvirus2_86 [Hyperionvirus sp.]|uniref:Uncharacterized protein n=1 Tax=Hyperionvirus sp. TaxID=2487770 RepID=A0A3G5A6B8_9VIRU|nr:MAG: hypothetical protein Hyperionvirus2_86 [Hyperionvirus sp.]
MSFYGKYQKYKQKYLKAKSNQIGGNNFSILVRYIDAYYGSNRTPLPSNIEMLARILGDINKRGELDLDNPEQVNVLKGLGERLTDGPVGLSNHFKSKVLEGNKDQNQKYDGGKILAAMFPEGEAKPIFTKRCSVEELMNLTHTELEKICVNHTDVFGSCGWPSYMESIKEGDISEGTKNSLIGLFTAVKNKLAAVKIKPEKMILDIGAWHESAFGGDNLNLRFMPDMAGSKPIEAVIEEINKADNLNQTYDIKIHFPLDNTKSREGEVINFIRDMMKEIRVFIINRICGTCFRSFYYLVKHGAEYKMGAAQGRSPVDTDEILSCFKNDR